jgi:lysophospholipase L1-like esterase
VLEYAIDKGYLHCNFYDTLENSGYDLADLIYVDGTHPNDKGQELMTACSLALWVA